jgi:hypothetical protein
MEGRRVVKKAVRESAGANSEVGMTETGEQKKVNPINLSKP